MKNIEIDDEVYSLLLKNVSEFGEQPNSVIRKLLGLDAINHSSAALKSPIEDLLSSTEFYFAQGVVGRFLLILSWIYKDKTKEFSKVQNVKGRGRIYFAQSKETLIKSGRSVNPKPIPETPYWVITTTSTQLKQDTLGRVMNLLNYDSASIKMAVKAIKG